MIESSANSDGKTTYLVSEPDAPDLTLLVTFPNEGSNPETDQMTFSMLRDGEDQGKEIVTLTGRAGLLEWYVKEVGYSPDEDIGAPTPINELVDSVGSHLLLRASSSWS